jgi:hypothetical protein
VNGTAEGICQEDPLNAVGQTPKENSEGVLFPFTRFSVVCTPGLNLPASEVSDLCLFKPDGTAPPELACNPAYYLPGQKEIKVLLTYRTGDGSCQAIALNHRVES